MHVNDISLQKHFSANIAEITKTAQPLSLVLLDIDHIKIVNGTYGHLTGDRVLQKLAQRLEIAHEEEFALILPRVHFSCNKVVNRKHNSPTNQQVGLFLINRYHRQRYTKSSYFCTIERKD
ncbi:diguanylate cyclase domain-containing protein [Sporosarcina sp. JAI121]|uniref:diguanylate cyclase domain-containing protein n=1 Tax=Sporosarcina sp. JAI121 TaxID=2723064 RepID=UPI0015C7B9EA|nr:diguanylate cyclase [Sporosarcina sp. JAI121]NYF23966.1 diguanylate cyclase (GGDEF)-like protein [Sporosarcina sp. JAI121]